MRKRLIITAALTLAVAALCALTLLTGAANNVEPNEPNEPPAGNLYPLTARVTGVNAVTDRVTIETATGITYWFFGIEDYAVNDMVSVIMNDNGTPIVYDDIITDVRFSGFTYYNY